MGKGGGGAGQSAGFAQAQANQQGIDEIRRQFDQTQRTISPFIKSGKPALGRLEGGATIGGLDSRLAEIFGTDTFGSLVDERQRAVQGQLSAGGLTRSGTALQEASRVPTDIGLMLEQLLSGRDSNLAGNAQNAALGLGQFGQGASSSIADLLAKSGQAASSGIVTDAQAGASKGTQTLQTIGTVASIAAMFFSDPSLKQSVERIGKIDDLNVYQWDWKPETKGTIIEGGGTIGFMADEVKALYPHHVGEYGGFMIIDYPRLLDELDMKWPH